MAGMTCASCRSELQPSDALCPRCGALLSNPGQRVVETPPSRAVAADGDATAATPFAGDGSGAPATSRQSDSGDAAATALTVAETGTVPGTMPSTRVSQPVKTLCVYAGCDRSAMTGSAYCRTHHLIAHPGRTFQLLTPWSDTIEIPDGTSIGIGRDPEFCTFADELRECRFVSRRHLFLTSAGGQLKARDRSSHNGTVRNTGDQLSPDEEVELVSGDTLTLGGQVTFVVA